MSSELVTMVAVIYYILVAIGNSNEDLGSLPPDGRPSGFLGNAVPSPNRYNFTLNFTINPDWTNVCFDDNATVCIIDPSGCGCIM